MTRPRSIGPGVDDEDDDELAAELIDAGSREHYADAALYDYEYRRRRADVNFYRQLAERQKTGAGGLDILELGAGTGRVTIPLARDGHRVVAIDRAPEMLARLETRVAALPAAARDRIEIVRGDLCRFEVPSRSSRAARRPAASMSRSSPKSSPRRTTPRRFPLVIAAFNVLEHLYTRGEFDACLQRVAAHLAPGGLFAFDVQLPDLHWLMRDPGKRWAKTRFTDPTTGRAFYYSTNHDYDVVSQIALIRIYYDPVEADRRGRVVKLTQRKYFPAELEALVSLAGMRVVERYGDFSWGPLTDLAESQVLVCEVPTRRRRRGDARRG